MNAMQKLAEEITRVTELRDRYRSIDGLPQVNAKLALFMMDKDLKEAQEANGSNDPVAVIGALKSLASWEE